MSATERRDKWRPIDKVNNTFNFLHWWKFKQGDRLKCARASSYQGPLRLSTLPTEANLRGYINPV